MLKAKLCGAMAGSSVSSFWWSIVGRRHAQQNIFQPSSRSRRTFLYGFRFMSTGASSKLFVGELFVQINGMPVFCLYLMVGLENFFTAGLSWSTDENVLTQAFSSYGKISEAKVVIDRETGRSRGFGFVSFMSIEDAESAKEAMDGNDINGRTVRVDFATEKPPSAGSFGGFASGRDGNFQ